MRHREKKIMAVLLTFFLIGVAAASVTLDDGVAIELSEKDSQLIFESEISVENVSVHGDRVNIGGHNFSVYAPNGENYTRMNTSINEFNTSSESIFNINSTVPEESEVHIEISGLGLPEDSYRIEYNDQEQFFDTGNINFSTTVQNEATFILDEAEEPQDDEDSDEDSDSDSEDPIAGGGAPPPDEEEDEGNHTSETDSKLDFNPEKLSITLDENESITEVLTVTNNENRSVHGNITVEPSNIIDTVSTFELPPGETRDLSILADSEEIGPGAYESEIKFDYENSSTPIDVEIQVEEEQDESGKIQVEFGNQTITLAELNNTEEIEGNINITLYSQENESRQIVDEFRGAEELQQHLETDSLQSGSYETETEVQGQLHHETFEIHGERPAKELHESLKSAAILTSLIIIIIAALLVGKRERDKHFKNNIGNHIESLDKKKKLKKIDKNIKKSIENLKEQESGTDLRILEKCLDESEKILESEKEFKPSPELENQLENAEKLIEKEKYEELLELLYKIEKSNREEED